MKSQKTLWPLIAGGALLGLVVWPTGVFILGIGLAIYLWIHPEIRTKALQAIDQNNVPALINALKQGLPRGAKVKPVKTKAHSTSKVTTSSLLSMKTKTIASVLTPLILIGGIILIIMDGLVNIPAGHVGVIFDRGRGVMPTELEEGMHLKIPFWQQAVLMNTRLQTYTMSTNLSEADLINNTKALQLQSLMNSSESAIRSYALQSGDSNNSIDALTKDGQRVTVDLTVQFQIDGQNASVIYRTIGLNYVDKVVRPAARSITREKVTGFTSKELYNEETRAQMEKQIEDSLEANFANKNIVLGDVLIRHIGFSQSYLNAIEEKQIAQQRIEKAEFEKQEAEIRKEKTIIEAEAEAESIKLKGEALASSPEVIQLQFVEKMAPQIKWGIMPEGGLPLLDIGQLTQ